MDAIKELKDYDGYIQSEQYKIRHRVIQEIKQLRLANSDLQMYYDYAKTECDKLQTEVLKLREELNELRLSYEVVVDALREKE
jgi:prephenate dehydrogenase